MDLSGMVYGVANGTATITYIFNNSCGADTATFDVTVNNTPTVASILGPTSVCQGASISLSDATPGGVWSSGSTSTASVSTTGTVYGVGAGTVTISYTVTSSCGTVYAVYPITVNPLPNAGTIVGTDSVCVGATVNLTNPTGTGSWSTSSAAVASVNTTGTVTGMSTGSTVISFTAVNGCGSVYATLNLRVLPLPSAGAISGSSTICTGASSLLSSTVAGGVWTSTSPSTASITSGGLLIGVAAGTATITYTYTNSCGSADASWPVTVNTTPTRQQYFAEQRYFWWQLEQQLNSCGIC
ncbi:MAG: hypothetical protein EBZ77_09200 [Chitinophagia bacterium]|nr:hypothetical protein [Chitinophagia bacterium]